MNFKKPFGMLLLAAMLSAASAVQADTTLFNASYSPTRDMYAEYNAAFVKYWKGKTGETVVMTQTHANSSTQAASVNNGLEADVVTLALALDVDYIANKGLINNNWQQRLQGNSAPYTSTIVFLVRKGNPKRIKDWSDLTRWGINVVIPNPKTAGAARWAYVAAWGYAMKQPGANELSAQNFLKRMYGNTQTLEYSATSATKTFAQRNIGDVLVSWENEALKTAAESPEQFDVVVPSMSVLAQPPVAVVDKIVDKKGTRKLAEGYLQYLYSPVGQEIAAKHFYRPTDPEVAAKYARQFPPLKLIRLEDFFPNWQTVLKTHFQDGGVFDRLYDQYRNAS